MMWYNNSVHSFLKDLLLKACHLLLDILKRLRGKNWFLAPANSPTTFYLFFISHKSIILSIYGSDCIVKIFLVSKKYKSSKSENG